MRQKVRDRFDRELKRVMRRLPPKVRYVLKEIPLIVEDYPSRHVMREQGIKDPAELCGLYDGPPEAASGLAVAETIALFGSAASGLCDGGGGFRSPTIWLYRRGLIELSRNLDTGRVRTDLLRKEIRTTIMHEVGHCFGLSEDDLEQRGYG